MKAAIISDIHGNLPALEAVMTDINKRKADKIICLGDIIGKGPNAKEAIEICQKECDIVLQGNWENSLYKTFLARNQGQTEGLSDKMLWYINSATPQQMEYLGNLPHSTEFYLSGKLIRIFHAHPRNFNRYHPTSPIEQRMELFDYNDNSEYKKLADVAIYADIHGAYMQILQGRHLINVGSVGNPLDISRASYVMLEGGEDADTSFGIQFIRVTYDIEKAITMAKEANIPDLDGYISELRTAKYFARTP